MAKPDPYADIDFEEITDATGLAVDEIKCLKVCGSLINSSHCCDLDLNDECSSQHLFCCH